MRRIGRLFGIALIALLVTGMTGWSILAIYYSDLPGESLRGVLASIFGVGTAGAFLVVPNRRRTLVGFLVVFVLLVGWWLSIAARNDRDWQPEVAVLPSAVIAGDRVTLRNIRDFDYRTETDFTPRYYDRTFDLQQLDSVDLIAVYWAGDAIAHIMVSFGFAGQDFVAFSIETRKERAEGYSAIKGFFKQYELVYVVGDERDLIGARTTYRHPREDVYLYRTRLPPERARSLFLGYLRRINQLTREPEFYNTLTTNCATNVVRHVQLAGGRARYNWKILLSGYAPEYAYELGSLDTSLPFAELRRLSYVNARAQAADKAPDFSRRIREGLPAPARPVRTGVRSAATPKRPSVWRRTGSGG